MKFQILTTIAILILATVLGLGQQPLRDQGIELYRKGDDAGAIAALEQAVKAAASKNDSDVWNTLGMAYMNKRELKKARNAFQKAVKLKPESSAYHANLAYAYLYGQEERKSEKETERAIALDPNYAFTYYVVATRHAWKNELNVAMNNVEKAIALRPNFGPAYLLKSDLLINQFGARLRVRYKPEEEIYLLKQASEILDEGSKKVVGDADRALLKRQRESLGWFHDYYRRVAERGPSEPIQPDPANVRPLKILYQPKANYTDVARSKNIQGAVRLAIHLGEDGKVQHIMKVWGLGYGLDEQAIEAAKQIRFEPKQVDGKPVSVVVIREYTFSIY